MPRTPDDVKKLAKESGAKIVDLRFIDLPGMWQHFSIPVEDLDEDLFTEGIGFDGSSIRGFQQIHESDMLLIADAETAVMDPVLSIPTLNIICNVFDPLTRKPYSRDPRYVAQKGRSLSQEHRHRRHQLLGSGGGVLHVRQRPLRPERAERLLLHRLQGRRLEHGARGESEPWLQAAPQGRLLPGAALGPVAGHPLGDHPGAQGRGREGRGAPPRGGHGRPGRDRHALRPARQNGRQSAHLQVHHPHDLQEARHDGHLHAQAALRRQRLRHARAPEPVEGRHQHLLRSPRATRCSARPRSTTSAACSSTHRLCSPSALPPPTPTAAWCRATKLR